MIGDRLFDEDRAAVPAWTLPFDALGAFRTLGIGKKNDGRRGLSFSIKRSRGLALTGEPRCHELESARRSHRRRPVKATGDTSAPPRRSHASA